MQKVVVKKDTYYDSVFLMQVTAQLKGRPGVREAQVTMGAPQNKALLANLGFTAGLEAAGPNDLVIAVEVDSEKAFAALEEAIAAALKAPRAAGSGCAAAGPRPSTIRAAADGLPGANLAIISVPGSYAPYETRRALARGLHVMLFSDNVPLEEEVALKRLGAARGLLVMGPDCGTAIVNGHPLCFANEVRRGPVGIVAASGTGAQEVSVLVDRFGSGCSQVLGTGGRDLSEAVGGIMMLQGIDALAADPVTKVIVVVSKPPAPKIADAVVARLERCGKPAVVHFIGRPGKPSPKSKVRFASSLEDTASQAVAAAGTARPLGLAEIDRVIASESKGKARGQRFVRGYFTGGTLCDEALYVLRETVSQVHSNIHPDKALRLDDPFKSVGHTLLDLGDDVFTAGRPHPMIEPSTRVERMLAEADDPTVAVWMLDVVLGHGSHADPAGALVPAIVKARAAAKRRKGSLTVLASVVGTERDFQGLAGQRAKLEAAGVRVLSSNARMAGAAAGILARMKA